MDISGTSRETQHPRDNAQTPLEQSHTQFELIRAVVMPWWKTGSVDIAAPSSDKG